MNLTCSVLSHDSPLFPEMVELLNLQFPPDERLDAGFLKECLRNGALTARAYFLEGKFVSCTVDSETGRYVTGFYFAVKPELMGKGIGTEIMRMLFVQFRGKMMFFDVEDPDEECPNREQRVARIRLYRRLGLNFTKRRHVINGTGFLTMTNVRWHFGFRWWKAMKYCDEMDELKHSARWHQGNI